MFDYKLIEAYGAVVKEEGFERAARRLNITQSAVSQRIKLLEEQFGQILLQRSNPPQPTTFGAKILGLYNQVSMLEEDLEKSRNDTSGSTFTSLPIGINADTLATWFFQAVLPFLQKNEVVLDMLVDDQEETHQFLRDGKVLGCVSTRRAPIQGCRALYLGDVTYSLYCSENFRRKWFSQGITRDAVQSAPMITFNRKDTLNERILSRLFDGELEDYATYYVPSSELFMDFIQNGLAYGAMPLQQSYGQLYRGLIHDLTPDHHEIVSLYWHCWNIDSTLLREFTVQLERGFRAMVPLQKGGNG